MKFPNLPAASALTGTEVVPVTQGGVDVKTTVQDIADMAPASSFTGGALSSALDEAKGANIASAATTDIGAATGNLVHVTGTTTITALGTVQAGTRRIVVFDGALTLTHNATSLILPTAANITTAAGDVAVFVSEGSGNWKCAGYMRASGGSLADRELGYIDGLKMEWVSTTSIRVTAGSAYIESTRRVLQSSTITKSSLSLSADTWYHLYLYDNAGAADIDVSTTSPASAYSGTARSKTGDTSRRYVGSIRSNGSSLLHNFQMCGNKISYLEQCDVTPFRVVNGGTATSATAVSTNAIVPVTARIAQIRLLSDSAQASRYKNSSSSATHVIGLGAGLQTTMDMALDASQEYQYFNAAAIGGSGVFNDLLGYVYER